MNENILSVRTWYFLIFWTLLIIYGLNLLGKGGRGSWVPCDGVLFVKEIVLHERVIIQTEDKLLLHVPQDVFLRLPRTRDLEWKSKFRLIPSRVSLVIELRGVFHSVVIGRLTTSDVARKLNKYYFNTLNYFIISWFLNQWFIQVRVMCKSLCMRLLEKIREYQKMCVCNITLIPFTWK